MTARDQIEPLDDAIAAIAPDVCDVMNGAYADSLALLARVLGDAPRLLDAEAVGIDAHAVHVRIVEPAGERTVRIAFATSVTDADRLSSHLLDLVDVARQRSSELGQTTAERERQELAHVRTFVTSVAAVRDVHPHLRLVTLAGGDLTEFAPLGPDTFLYVMLPPPGRTELTVGADFTWERAEAMPPEDRPVGAYYTARAWRPDVHELDLLFVLHEPPGAASGWAERARPGDPVAVWGPRQSFHPPLDTGWFLLVGDDTGLPAIAAIVESLPSGTPVRVVAEVESPAEQPDLPTGSALEVVWVYRDGAAPGTVPERTVAAVRALELPGQPGFAWGGGESRTMTAVRRHLRHDRGLPRDRVSLIAYWRHDRS